MKILGLSAHYHDSAACMIVNGNITAAAQEERFTRMKHDKNFPVNAINYCIKDTGCHPEEIDHIVFYEKPFLKFERLFETYLAFAPKGFSSFSRAMPIWLKDKLFQKVTIARQLNNILGDKINWVDRLLFSEHHLSHAASTFFPSPFEEAAILTMDGVGEWTTTSLTIGKGNTLNILKEIQFPHSLGLLYSAMTAYTGFKVNSGEYKMMGLAPYGKPKYINLIKDHLIDIKDDGSFKLNLNYFDYCTGLKMTSKKFNKLFGGPSRNPESVLTQRHMDLASSVQTVIEEVVIKLAKDIAISTGMKNLCLAGGVALNCVANGKLKRKNLFDRIWIQPAAGDAGGALGAALSAYHIMLNKERKVIVGQDKMKGSYLGPEFKQSEVEKYLESVDAVFTNAIGEELITITAESLADNYTIGWFQGKMEFGPRALGCRSIIANPCSPTTQKQLNLKIKFRESFRPFAPSILIDDLSEWFDIDSEDPYMLFTSYVTKSKRLPLSDEQKNLIGLDKLNISRSRIPAVTHVDYSARVQTVHKEINPLFYSLITQFKKITGCPLIVNTSFNVRSEPIVCTPEDAFKCFMGADLDMLVIGNSILYKSKQPSHLLTKYSTSHRKIKKEYPN